MEIASIKTNNRNYSVFCDDLESENLKIYGYYFEHNQFYPLNDDIFKELEILKLGNNKKNIGTYNYQNINYDVILDIDTNLKHYFYNGKENYNLFINNFDKVIMADTEDNDSENHNSENNNRNMSDNKVLIMSTCHFLLSLATFSLASVNPMIGVKICTNAVDLVDTVKSKEIADKMNNFEELTIEELETVINSNLNIDEKEKKYY